MDKLIGEVTRLCGGVSLQEFDSAVSGAIEKLEYMINREGDANGARYSDSYLAHLVAEQIRERRQMNESVSDQCRN